MYLDYIERNRISKEQKYHTGLKTKSSTMFIYIKSILNTANYRGGGGGQRYGGWVLREGSISWSEF